MGILLAFAPFLAFVLVDRLASVTDGLVAGAAAALILVLRDAAITRRAPKLLELGTLVLFAGLAGYALFAHPAWSVIGVRLRVDTGLLVLILATLATGRPFTLDYARDGVPAARRDSPVFLRVNQVITLAWALAFAVIVAAEAALLYDPALPHRLGVWVILLALFAAVKFSSWYPQQARARAASLRS